jgi:hypothetical protein
MKTTSLMTALVAAAAAAGIAVLPASGQDQPTTRTLTFVSTEKPNDEKFIDAKPKGYSVGDRFLLSSLLHSGSKIAGRVEAACSLQDPTYHAQACTLTVILADGQITLQGAGSTRSSRASAEPARATRSPAARRVRRRRGTMTRKGNGKKDTLTFTLQ